MLKLLLPLLHFQYKYQLLHQLMIIETLTDIELACLYAPNERFVPIDEILARAPATTRDAPNPLSIAVTLRPNSAHPIIRSPLEAHVIPDALYGIEYEMDGQKLYRFWALECERTSPASRSTTVKSSTALKRAAYHAMIATKAFQGHWGIPNLELNVR